MRQCTLVFWIAEPLASCRNNVPAVPRVPERPWIKISSVVKAPLGGQEQVYILGHNKVIAGTHVQG